MNELYKMLNELIGITEAEWLTFSAKLIRREVKAKTLLVSESQVAKNIYFIESGLLRTYHLQDDKEVNSYFACDNQFIATFSSFISQTPSFENLETIDDSIVYEISYIKLHELYDEHRKFEKLGRILAEKNYMCMLDRAYLMQTKTAKQKYMDFMENYNEKIIQRLPQYHLASFLGIAPESLSRVRKEILKS